MVAFGKSCLWRKSAVKCPRSDTMMCLTASGNQTHDLMVRCKHEDHRAIAAWTSESHAVDADSGGIYSYSIFADALHEP